jgi:hypothetical protein
LRITNAAHPHQSINVAYPKLRHISIGFQGCLKKRKRLLGSGLELKKGHGVHLGV